MLPPLHNFHNRDDSKVAKEYLWIVRSIRDDDDSTAPTISAPDLLVDVLLENEALLLKYLYAHGGDFRVGGSFLVYGIPVGKTCCLSLHLSLASAILSCVCIFMLCYTSKDNFSFTSNTKPISKYDALFIYRDRPGRCGLVLLSSSSHNP